MTKISQYSTDVNITGNDKWIGSDAQNFLITKNFTPNNLANYFNENNVIDIGTSIRYRYQTLLPGEAREQGTISFETEIGPQVNFSAITTFLIAKNTLKGNTVTQYLDFLVDGKVLLSRASNINIFGYYKITSIEPWIPNTNFFVVEVDFLSGNGFISEDLDYLVSLVDKVQDIPPPVWGSITGDIEDQTDLINYISSQIITPTLQSVTDDGSTTTNSITVAGITSGNFVSDGYNVTISDSNDGIYNFYYVPYSGLFIGNGVDTYTQLGNDASIGFQNFAGGYGNLRSDLVTGSWSWQLPDASGTLALTSNIGTWGALNYPTWVSGTPFVKMTAAGTFALDTTSYYPYPTGTISQYIRGDGTLATFPSVTTPTLQQVTTAGNTTTNDIKIGTGSGGTGTYFLLQPNGFENYFAGGYNLSTPTFFQTRRENTSSSSIFSVLNVQENSTSLGSYNLTDSGQINVFPTQVSIGVQDNPLTEKYGINVYKNKINFTALIGSLGKSINLLLDYTAVNSNIYFPASGGTLALLSDVGVTSVTATSPITSSGGATPDISTSMATNKLIGRSTAGVGVMEETAVTSVGLTMPSAFTVTNSPITSSGDIAVTGAGLVSQYVRGDGTLANFPNSTGGGSSVNYYLNGSVSQGTFGGDTYYQMSKTPILGAGTNFTRTNGAGNGYIASFITDAGDPSFLNIPGGNWNLEFYFNASSGGGSPSFYAELYKVSATNVFTLIASDSLNPEGITNGTTVDQYFTSIPVPQTTLLVTDRLAVRIYVITSGRTITLHTENGNLCEVLTTFTTGLTALNGLTDQVQFFDVGTGATNFNISSSGDTHTFNLLFNIRRNANNSSNNNINYNGYAVTGSAESSAVWTITRLTIAASGSITVATATNVAWTDRETTIYT
jgi:hypothetical protein